MDPAIVWIVPRRRRGIRIREPGVLKAGFKEPSLSAGGSRRHRVIITRPGPLHGIAELDIDRSRRERRSTVLSDTYVNRRRAKEARKEGASKGREPKKDAFTAARIHW